MTSSSTTITKLAAGNVTVNAEVMVWSDTRKRVTFLNSINELVADVLCKNEVKRLNALFAADVENDVEEALVG